ncbi:class I SAM-dependent methyltransferase [Mycobacterium sp. CBMA271]|uniref:class I SAM-dependent methyltransferase n=1 Tax=unclassified Mycobacteroides TaxID=2618759 RepID=UPI0013229DD6|nr:MULTISPECIES: class I SAM-dependent methyltransferase [unclassified Mycobacteroides]MUM17567.1 methyltransferase [Mycobacteroides sp. CBMA 326]MUM24638.1 class I SAM-dependent methyltransferase [Mycobacteroides sp. CBMA 271]
MSPEVPDHTAVRTALWRALHVELDPPPHVLTDAIGLQLVEPPPDWRQRPDMDPQGSLASRLGMVARTRFVEDLVAQEAAAGVGQYVILGAGLDTFAQRHPDVGRRLTVFEVDQPQTQAWKRKRLSELGFGIPDWLRLVPVDFEAGGSWWDQLQNTGFDAEKPAVVASTGVSMYLTRDAIAATLRQCALLAPGSTLAMTFLLPLELLDESERPIRQMIVSRAAESGTPWVSFFAPDQMLSLARECGFTEVSHMSGRALIERYVPGNALSAEEFLMART